MLAFSHALHRMQNFIFVTTLHIIVRLCVTRSTCEHSIILLQILMMIFMRMNVLFFKIIIKFKVESDASSCCAYTNCSSSFLILFCTKLMEWIRFEFKKLVHMISRASWNFFKKKILRELQIFFRIFLRPLYICVSGHKNWKITPNVTGKFLTISYGLRR